jgi:DNA-binding NarL/FixJ family response regulator
LTARELEVLAAVREGLTNDEIAARLVVSEGTVRKHLQNASAKLGAHTRAEAAALAWR